MADIFPQAAGVVPFDASFITGASDASYALDAQNEAVAFVFQMPVDDTITHVIFTNQSKTGTPADDSYTLSLQSVTNGVVSGILGGGFPASQTFPNATYPVAGFGSGTGHIIQLANSIALQGGTTYGAVIQRTAATDASNFLTIRCGRQFAAAVGGTPWIATADSTPTWTDQTHGFLHIGIRSATRTYLFPAIAIATQSVGTTTEKGCSFTAPSAYGASGSFKLRGFKFIPGTALAAAGTYTVNLYADVTGTNPTILQTTGTVDSDDVGSATGARVYTVYFPEDSLVALTPGTKYGIGVSHSSAGGWGVNTITLADANCRDAYPFGGLTYMSRTLASAYPPDSSDGAFSETTTTIVWGELLWADYTAPSGGGGGLKIVGVGGLAG